MRKVKSLNLASVKRISHGFFTRNGGVSEGIYRSMNIGLGSKDSKECISENRNRICLELGVPNQQLATPYQVHSTVVATVTEAWKEGQAPKADAVVTDRPNLAIGISTADCGPVLFADGNAGVIGASHAGWRGALAGVLEATLDAMESVGAQRHSIIGVLGPTISKRSYEVGEEFKEQFLASGDSNQEYFSSSSKPNHFMFDLPSYIVMRLEAAKIGTVENLDLCTYLEEDRFFSYRRACHRKENDYGRQLSAIALKEDI